MKKLFGRVPVLLVTVLAAVVAFVLRRVQLDTLVDEAGHMMAGAGKGPLTWVCLAFAVLAALYSVLRRKHMTMERCAQPLATVLTLGAAFLMALGSASMWHELRIVALGGLVTAVCWVVVALKRQQKMKASAALMMLPALFFAVQLIVEFRDWSRDPQIMDYCFDLFARISVMCATFHLGGFGLGRGKGGVTVFFCLCGVVFSAAAMAGAGLGAMLTAAAAALWLLANLWLLLDGE